MLSWLMLDHGASLTQQVLGQGQDPLALIWCLAWWPWAAAHHIFNVQTHLLWQPRGLNLAWTTNVPLLALIAAPVTLLAGPLLVFNLFTLAAPTLAAWAAYFLCLDVCALPLAALFGGFLYGFSSYEAAQSLTHLNLDFTALIPLILLLALRRVRGQMQRGPVIVGLGLLLGAQFLINDELLALGGLFGAIAFMVAWARMPAWRVGLATLACDAACAAPLALFIALPLLWPMLTGPFDIAHSGDWAWIYAVDALNFVIPTRQTWLGGRAFGGVSTLFSGGVDEQSGYLGMPLILLFYAMLRESAFRRRHAVLLLMLGLSLLASLGAHLNIGGVRTGVVLPWVLLRHVPLLGAALPARCMLFAWLCAALLGSAWLAEAPNRLRLAAAGVVCLFLFPAPHPTPAAPDSAFFRPGRVQAVLGPNPNLLILPFSVTGPSSYWQAENQFGFTQAGGYLGFPPAWAQADKGVDDLYLQRTGPALPAEIAALCRNSGVQYVVLGPGASAGERAAMAALDWPSEKIDDVTIFTVKRSP